MITKLTQLVDVARSRGRKKIVVAYAQDLHTLEAVDNAIREGLVEATLVGNSEQIKETCKKGGIEYSQFTVIEEDSDVKCVEIAVKMVSSGNADILMKGLVTSDKYMRGILNKEYGLLPHRGILSHVTVIKPPTYHKLLVIADVAVIPYPDIRQKQAITSNIIRTAQTLGVESPKVACIAPSEQMLPGISSCVDAAIISKMGDRGQFGKALIDGPLALDVALDVEDARIKKLKSEVAGDADCLLFPNIDAANVFFKTITKLCGGEMAGMVAGTTAPCVLTSRGDSKESKLYSIALACMSVK